MLWLLTIPVIGWFTFVDLINSHFPNSFCGPDYDPCRPLNFLEWCFLVAMGTFITAFISLVPILIAAFIGSLGTQRSTKDRDYPLVALRQQDGFAGRSFFLGSGYVGDRQYYFWYRQDGDHISGGKTYRQPSVRIYEGNYEPIMRTWKVKRGAWHWLVGCLIGMDLRDDDEWLPDFYLPTGSIKEGYTL